MEIAIRPVRHEDMPELIHLCAEHAEYERTAYSQQGKEEQLATALFAPDPPVRCVVAESEAGLVGYATFMKEYSTWEAASYMHMDCLFLRPAARNQGVGLRMMRAIAQQALTQGITRMQWQTPSFNAGAIRFYERMGPLTMDKVRMFLGEAELRVLAG